MNRKIRKAFLKEDAKITALVRNLTIRRLKALSIDYIVSDGKIISTQNKMVEKIYNQTMMDVMIDFEKLGGKIYKLKQAYGIK
jgi:hypothetical protein